MITVTSAEKKKIEGQIRTALPFVNSQTDITIEIHESECNRSLLTFTKENAEFVLPIFYLTPSTDEQAWTTLENEMNRNLDKSGIFFVKFEDDNHLIGDAKTFALTKADLANNGFVDEDGKVVFNEETKVGRFALQLFDADQMNYFYDQLMNQSYDESVFQSKAKVAVGEDSIQEPEEMTADVKSIQRMESVQKEMVNPDVKPMVQPSEKTAVVDQAVDDKKEMNETEKAVNLDANPVTAKTDKKLEDDIKALISDCFGIF